MQGEGYQTDIDTGQKYGKLNRGGARALFDIRLSDAASFDPQFSRGLRPLRALLAVDPERRGPGTARRRSRPPGCSTVPPAARWVRVGGLPLYKDETGAGTVATLNVRFDGLTLTSISAFDDFSDHSLDNYDGYPAADNNWTKNFQQRQFSQELRLASATRWPRGLDRGRRVLPELVPLPRRARLDVRLRTCRLHHGFRQGHHRREFHAAAVVARGCTPTRKPISRTACHS